MVIIELTPYLAHERVTFYIHANLLSIGRYYCILINDTFIRLLSIYNIPLHMFVISILNSFASFRFQAAITL